MNNRQHVPIAATSPRPFVVSRSMVEGVADAQVVALRECLRELVKESIAMMSPLPTPRHAWEDAARDRPMSSDRLMRLLVLSWLHPSIPREWPLTCVARINAMLHAIESEIRTTQTRRVIRAPRLVASSPKA